MPEILSFNPLKDLKNSLQEKKDTPLDNQSFVINCDPKTEIILKENKYKEELSKITKYINNILGQNNHIRNEKINIYLFSDKQTQLNFIKHKFPDKFEIYAKDNASFDLNPITKEKSIINYTPIKELSTNDLPKLKKAGITIEQAEKIIQETAFANIMSSIAHELSHLHPFFGGVGNIASDNKWEQEQVCSFIGEKIRIHYGATNFREQTFKKAQGELKNKPIIDLEHDGYNWDVRNYYEEFFYPYLEKRFGLTILYNLWVELFKNKINFNTAIEKTYGTNIVEDFKDSMLKASTYREIES